MKKYYITISLVCISLNFNAQVGINTNTPNATLDIVGNPTTTNTKDGVIPPKVTRTQLAKKVTGTYGSSQTGAIVYVTDETTPTGTTPSIAQTTNIDSKGYYFFDGSLWQKFSNREPWNQASSTNQAVANNQNIYQNGFIGISKSDASSNTATYFQTRDISRALSIVGDGKASDDIHIQTFSNISTDAGTLTQNRTRGSVGAATPVNSGDNVGDITFAANGATGINPTYLTSARISGIVGATTTSNPISPTNVPIDLKFETGNSDSVTERLRITSDGNIGIGTNSPTVNLEIKSRPTETTALDGVLPPKLTGDQIKSKTYTEAQDGTIIYATSAASPANLTGQTENINMPGLYHFDGPTLKWYYLGTNPIFTNFRSMTGQTLNITSTEDQVITFTASDANTNLATIFDDTNDTFKIKYKGSYQISGFIGYNPNQPTYASATDYIAVNLKLQRRIGETGSWTDISGVRFVTVGIECGVGTAIQLPASILNLNADDYLRLVIQRPNITINGTGNKPFGDTTFNHINLPNGQYFSKMFTIMKVK